MSCLVAQVRLNRSKEKFEFVLFPDVTIRHDFFMFAVSIDTSLGLVPL